MKLKLKDDVSLAYLEAFGFEYNDHLSFDNYARDFLAVDKNTREINIYSGVDEVNGNEELIAFYILMTAGLVEIGE